MNPHFDPEAYWRAGHCPWTFFAYPLAFADDAGLPLDDEAKRLLCALQGQGVPVGTWVNAPGEETAYFACPKEAIGRLNEALTALEEQGIFEKGFCSRRTEYLFSLLEKPTTTEPKAGEVSDEPGNQG